MALYDMFEEYRNPNLSEDEQLDVAEARELDGMMRNDPSLAHEPGGVRNKGDGVFVPYPLVQTHIGIAMNRAQAQFKDFDRQQLVMPEDLDVSIRFPGIDPVGKYSVIDMKFAQREADLRAALESRSPEVQAYVNGMLNRCGDRQSAFCDVRQQMLQASIRHRQITRASKLCLDADGRRLLHQQSRVLETELQVEQYDKLMQGLEYAAGVRQGPVPKEITDFYKDRLNTELDLGMVNAARNLNQVPPKINVEFQNLDHKMLQQAFANPHNWGKSPDEVAKAADGLDIDVYSTAIPAYAVATADRVIDPLFREMEKNAPANAQGLDIEFSRGDMISIDGVTIREIMQRGFDKRAKANQVTGSFADFYKKNVKRAANELVAAGLMAGKRVETFVPDKYGRIPKEPTQITKTGYEPSPLKPEKFNAWQRHFAKRGFYKAKVARQAEYERVMAARERMKESAQASADARAQERLESLQKASDSLMRIHPGSTAVKNMFFGKIVEERAKDETFRAKVEGPMHVTETDAAGHQREFFSAAAFTALSSGDGAYRKFSRVEPVDTCIAILAAQGHDIHDIMDPNKLQAEREAAARDFMEHSASNDQEWLGRVFYAGHKATLAAVAGMTRGQDITSDAYRAELPYLETLTRAAFGISQDLATAGCREGYMLAACEEIAKDKNHITDDELLKGSTMAEALNDKIGDISMFTEKFMQGLQAELTLAKDPANASHMKMIQFAVARMTQDNMRPGATILEQAPTSLEMGQYTAAASESIMQEKGPGSLGKIHKKLLAPENLRNTAMAAASGSLMGSLHTRMAATPALDAQKKPRFRRGSVDFLVRQPDGSLVKQRKETSSPDEVLHASFAIGKEAPDPLAKKGPQLQNKQKQAPQAGPKR